MRLFCSAILAVVMVAVAAQSQDDDVPRSTTGCFCVHYLICNLTTKVIIDDGETLLGSRVNVPQECSCPGPDSEFGGECSDRNHMCCHEPGYEEEEEEEGSWEECGIKGLDLPYEVLNPKVIGGYGNGFTLAGAFPWMALLVNKSDNSMVCGGSILHHHVIMTAAHCVRRFQEDELLVRAGVWDQEVLRGTQTSAVEKIIEHEQFGHTNYRNDLALLVLKKGLVLSEDVAPICLAQADSNYDTVECTATGWGTFQFGTKNYSRTLKKVNLRIVPHSECQTELRATRLGPWFKLHNSFVCAKGENGADTCTGDGGGPLVCRLRDSDKYVQIGITAAGLGCGNDIPALYTNIAHLQPWIERQLITAKLKDLK